ncbi:MT-A70-domain-containing protein [Auricularia subglabra TFB-10046 SS5]|nr:MT-A70-domain-containing protein [Auricularia subglabra TFB-10046 SS5]
MRPDLPPPKKARVERYRNYVAEEETIRNDYSQRYVDSGEYPQNWVLGAEPERRFEEYPKQQRLLALKKEAVASTAHTPYYAPLSQLVRGEMAPAKFDVILLDPPYSSSFTFDTLSHLPIPTLAADPSFVFMWVGSGAGEALERGREVLAKWGYRRCEDIVWVKTNKATNCGPGSEPPTSSLLTRTKQHCLMGIRGTVRRSTDSWFVHCNVDTDVIVWEGDPEDPTRKPPEMYTLIENFCLGLRRLEVFGRAHSLRPGWLTVGDATELAQGNEVGAQAWTREGWEAELGKTNGKIVVPMTSEIDALRPKSPVRNNPPQHMQGPGPGMGMNMGPMNMGMPMGMVGGPMQMGMGGPPPTMNVPLRFDATGGLNVALPPQGMGMMGGGGPGMQGIHMGGVKPPGMGMPAPGGIMPGQGNMMGGPRMGPGGGMGPMGMGGGMGMGGMPGMQGPGPGGMRMGPGGGMGMGFPPGMGGGGDGQMWDPSQQMGMDPMGMNMNMGGGEWY